MRDLREYVARHGKLILWSIIVTLAGFGFLVFSDNLRIDTEELVNAPGTTLGWLAIGRFSLVLFKRMLGLAVHSVWKSGLLFLIFFLAGANLLTFAYYCFSGKSARYPYWVFLILYCTSNIWSFQVYFSLQQAEIGLAMFLTAAAACLAVHIWFQNAARAGKAKKILFFLSGIALLVLGLGAYQALAAYYIVICITLFLVYLKELTSENAEEEQAQNRRICRGILTWFMQFFFAYLLYRWIAETWFMAAGGYMDSQMGWGNYPAADCIKNVLRTARNVLAGIGPRNFSFYTIGMILVFIMELTDERKGRTKTKGRLSLRLFALAGVMGAPFLMTLYMGEMLVTRSQFALPVSAAFLGMYGMDRFSAFWKEREVMRRAVSGCVLAVSAAQIICLLRLSYTDDVRFGQDKIFTAQVIQELTAANEGTFPTQPVLFVGYRKPELNRYCRRTEMYGWSFYEWDYRAETPTGATHRIAGLLKAGLGIEINEESTEEERRAAVLLAETMPDFPADGSVVPADGFIVVRLSEVVERTDIDWY